MLNAKTRLFISASSLALGLAAVGLGAEPALPLVQQADLVYEGAFRLPTGTFGTSTFEYGGYAIAYNAEHNSLFIVGHDHHQQVAEISIPEIRKGTDLAQLDTAAVLQPFADALEGRAQSVNPTDPNPKKIGGLLPYRGRLLISVYSYYDAAKSQVVSHFVSGTNLQATGDVLGPFEIRNGGAGLGVGFTHFIDGYFAEVPANLQSMLGGPVVNGNCCVSIITGTSYGPSLSVIDPAEVGVKQKVSATPLIAYPKGRFINDWDVQSKFFNGTTHVRGVVIPSGTRSVLFFGRHGLGPFCYGTGGVAKPGYTPQCEDPVEDYKGTHGYPYGSSVWAYDAVDLGAVKAGRKKPWDVRPYATWELKFPFRGWGDGNINGATFDPQTGRIFLTQQHGDGASPLVNVYKAANATNASR